METDPGKIKKLAKEKDGDNRKFRTFLETGGMTGDEVDAIVMPLFAKFSAEIDCRACGNCCRHVSPVLSENDIRMLAKVRGMTPADFRERYVVRARTRAGLIFRDKPCRFLKGKWCSVYRHRPKDCREYPHPRAKGFVSRLGLVLESFSVCPIVYNVVEAARKELSVRYVPPCQ